MFKYFSYVGMCMSALFMGAVIRYHLELESEAVVSHIHGCWESNSGPVFYKSNSIHSYAESPLQPSI